MVGDRYGTRAGVPEAVLDAMAPYVDVLSVQTFPGLEPVSLDAALEQIGRWHERTTRPALIADTEQLVPHGGGVRGVPMVLGLALVRPAGEPATRLRSSNFDIIAS